MRVRRSVPLLVAAAVLGAATAGPATRSNGPVRLPARTTSALARAQTLQVLSTSLDVLATVLDETGISLDAIAREALKLRGGISVSRTRLSRAEALVGRILGESPDPASAAVASDSPADPSMADEGPASPAPAASESPSPAPAPAAAPGVRREQADRAYDLLAVAVRSFQATVARTHLHLRDLQREARSMWRELDRQRRRIESIVSVIREQGSTGAGGADPVQAGTTATGRHVLVQLAGLRAELRRVQQDLLAQRAGLGRQERGAGDRLSQTLAKGWVPTGVAASGSGVLSLCPVDPPRSFTDDFGAPRWAGGFHLHQGNDIFAPYGTPIRAPFDGRAQSSPNSLGGLSVTVYGAAGFVYNAHLSSYGTLGEVTAGTVIGYVGNSGDAQGTSPHDHFEWHPGGGPAVDPYPFLIKVC